MLTVVGWVVFLKIDLRRANFNISNTDHSGRQHLYPCKRVKEGKRGHWSGPIWLCPYKKNSAQTLSEEDHGRIGHGDNQVQGWEKLQEKPALLFKTLALSFLLSELEEMNCNLWPWIDQWETVHSGTICFLSTLFLSKCILWHGIPATHLRWVWT